MHRPHQGAPGSAFPGQGVRSFQTTGGEAQETAGLRVLSLGRHPQEWDIVLFLFMFLSDLALSRSQNTVIVNES